MKKIIHIAYLSILYSAMAVVNGILFVFGPKQKIVNKKLLLGSMILTLFVISPKKSQAQRTCYKASIDDNPKVITYTKVEEMPSFPGGEDACRKFILDNLKYPEEAKNGKIEGTVMVSFVIKPGGELTDVGVYYSIGGGCDEEAIRIVKMMPNWIPGKQDGKAVWVQYNLPIKFELN